MNPEKRRTLDREAHLAAAAIHCLKGGKTPIAPDGIDKIAAPSGWTLGSYRCRISTRPLRRWCGASPLLWQLTAQRCARSRKPSRSLLPRRAENARPDEAAKNSARGYTT